MCGFGQGRNVEVKGLTWRIGIGGMPLQYGMGKWIWAEEGGESAVAWRNVC